MTGESEILVAGETLLDVRPERPGPLADEPPVTVDHPGFWVDTTVVGDAFLAGAITALLEGRSLESTLAFANAVAATAITDAGAMAALPTRGAVESMLEEC